MSTFYFLLVKIYIIVNIAEFVYFFIDRLNLDYLGYPESVAIGSLPGCKHRFINRDLNADAG